MASGIPSSRRQISATALAVSGGSRAKSGETAQARSTNRRSHRRCGRDRQRGTSHNRSSASPKPSRLVANTLSGPARSQDRLDEIRRGVENVFAVVEHQEPPPARERVGDARRHREPGRRYQPHRGGNGVRYRVRITHRRAARPTTHHRDTPRPPGRRLHRQAGLAHPAYTGQRHKPMSLQRRLHLVEFGLTPDEAAGGRPQIPRTAIECPQHGNSVRSPGDRTWRTPTGADTSRNRRGPRSRRSTPVSRTAVDSATRI